jgi:hypothetical protein
MAAQYGANVVSMSWRNGQPLTPIPKQGVSCTDAFAIFMNSPFGDSSGLTRLDALRSYDNKAGVNAIYNISKASNTIVPQVVINFATTIYNDIQQGGTPTYFYQTILNDIYRICPNLNPQTSAVVSKQATTCNQDFINFMNTTVYGKDSSSTIIKALQGSDEDLGINAIQVLANPINVGVVPSYIQTFAAQIYNSPYNDYASILSLIYSYCPTLQTSAVVSKQTNGCSQAFINYITSPIMQAQTPAISIIQALGGNNPAIAYDAVNLIAYPNITGVVPSYIQESAIELLNSQSNDYGSMLSLIHSYCPNIRT